MHDDREGGAAVSTHVVSMGPCPKCGSPDNLKTYADGHQHCFSAGCGYHVQASGEEKGTTQSETFKATRMDLFDAYGADQSPRRGISTRTLQRYGVFTTKSKGAEIIVYPEYAEGGLIAAQKLRRPDKTFPWVYAGDMPKDPQGHPAVSRCWLWGRNVYGDNFDKRIVITEGEEDAMSVAEVTDFKFPAVSIVNGAAAAKASLQANYLWLDRFEEIILWFDDDEAGRQAVAECAPLFAVGKVRIAKALGFKDANAALQAKKPSAIEAAVWGASLWRPAGIVNASANPDDVTAPKDEATAGFHWPWPFLEKMVGPMRPGQVVYHVAGTGIGKSSVVAEVAHNVLQQGGKIAWMGFEDTRRETKMRFLSIQVDERLDLNPRPDPEMVKLHEEVFGPGRVELFDPESAEWTMEAIIRYVRYCAKALECQFIVLDPLSFIAAGIDLEADTVKALDRASQEIARAAKELGVHIQVAHHLRRTMGIPHEEGAPTSINELRGSGSIANFAGIVLGWERNQQAEGLATLLQQCRVLKNRRVGPTGVAGVLEWNPISGRYKVSNKAFPEPGKPGQGGNNPHRGGFGRAPGPQHPEETFD
jgi:twinkle protein